MAAVGGLLMLFLLWCQFAEVHSENGYSYEECDEYIRGLESKKGLLQKTMRVNNYKECKRITSQWPFTRSLINVGNTIGASLRGIVMGVVTWITSVLTAIISAVLNTLGSLAMAVAVAAVVAFFMFVSAFLKRFNKADMSNSYLGGLSVRPAKSHDSGFLGNIKGISEW